MDKIIESFSEFLKDMTDDEYTSHQCEMFLNSTVRKDDSIEAQNSYQHLEDLAKTIDEMSDKSKSQGGVLYSKNTISAFQELVRQISKDMNATASSKGPESPYGDKLQGANAGTKSSGSGTTAANMF